MRCLAVVALAAGCTFSPRLATTDDAGPADMPVTVGVDPPWWDAGFGSRFRIGVTPGATRPDKGYAAYTVGTRPFDPAALRVATTDCRDLRIATWDGQVWTERPRHLLGCGTATAELRFALPVDIPDGTTWRDAFVYTNNAAAGAPADVTPTNVYLWWDPATSDRGAQYVHGRMDAWLAAGHDNSLAWNSEGFYTYDTGDDSQSSYRIAVDERDVLVEAEWFHTGCYTNNMQSGVCARGIITSGAGASELADHYYCTTRAQNPSCNDNDQGIYDGDIVKTDNEIIALQGTRDPPAIATNQWRKQALATFGIAPTQLRFWDSDTGWPGLAAPPSTALQATGTDAADHQGRGFAGIMTAQDIARVRGLVIRRYVEPEPTVVLEAEEIRP